MILKMPAYCQYFKCSAERCSDNCCIGWEIDIDESTADFYKTVEGDFGKRLKESIAAGECTSFILKGERCPFLNRKNLCDIIINLGQEHLCQICSDHPRYFEWYGELKEGGVGLCCEEAARLILTAENPLEFTESEIAFEEGYNFEGELFECLYGAREKIFNILCDENKSILVRVGEVLGFAENLQMNIDNYIYHLPVITQAEETGEKGDLLSVLKSLTLLEPIDESWKPYLKNLIDNFNQTDKQTDFSFYQRNLLIYFIYRYFLKGVFDGEILSKVKLAAVSTAVITYIMEKEKSDKGEISLNDIINICKLYSKQVEYSQENLDLLADLSYEKDFFQSGRIKELY